MAASDDLIQQNHGTLPAEKPGVLAIDLGPQPRPLRRAAEKAGGFLVQRMRCLLSNGLVIDVK